MRWSKEVELQCFKRYIYSLKDWDDWQQAIKMKLFRNILRLIGK
jgi:hypothetical protein